MHLLYIQNNADRFKYTSYDMFPILARSIYPSMNYEVWKSVDTPYSTCPFFEGLCCVIEYFVFHFPAITTVENQKKVRLGFKEAGWHQEQQSFGLFHWKGKKLSCLCVCSDITSSGTIGTVAEAFSMRALSFHICVLLYAHYQDGLWEKIPQAQSSTSDDT